MIMIVYVELHYAEWLSRCQRSWKYFFEINTSTFYPWIVDSLLQFLNYASSINRSGFGLHYTQLMIHYKQHCSVKSCTYIIMK